MEKYDYLFKIILVGESGVGKTSLLNRLVNEPFNDNYLTTIGVDFKIKTFYINNKSVKLQIWDTAGQERFNSITDSFFRGSQGIIIVFDLTNKLSFMNITKWINKKKNTGSENTKIIIVGNKCDLYDQIEVNDSDINYLRETNNLDYYETSAKMNINFFEPFYQISKSLIEINNFVSCKPNNELVTSSTKYIDISNQKNSDCYKHTCC